MGGKVEKDDPTYSTPQTHPPKKQQVNDETQSANKLPVFGGPEDYKHLTPEEKEQLTQDMMAKHKAWAENDKPTGGKGCQTLP